MFNIKMVSTVNAQYPDGDVYVGEVLYEESFDNLKLIDVNDFIGENFMVEITNTQNGSKLILEDKNKGSR